MRKYLRSLWKLSMKHSSIRKPVNLMGTRAHSAFCRKWQVNYWPDRMPLGSEWSYAHQKCLKSGIPFSRQLLATGYAKRYLTSSVPSSKFSHQGKSKWMLWLFPISWEKMCTSSSTSILRQDLRNLRHTYANLMKTWILFLWLLFFYSSTSLFPCLKVLRLLKWRKKRRKKRKSLKVQKKLLKNQKRRKRQQKRRKNKCLKSWSKTNKRF